jgi:hypothetical protein
MDVWQLIAERKIQKAMEEGAFDGLEGAGKPLDLSEDPFVDSADRMAYRLLKNNGFAPDWIEEAKELEAEARRLRAEGVMPKGSYQDRVAALNHRIELFNLKVPFASLQKWPFEL